ncbi:MAG: nuclear transport factor 2 family protein [Dehalococcoidia bacterium]|nr:nuclear transport factor 2 family protein [Dehalococcoidia bacterium]MCA9850773.1 nuclear transport factor 2 family protein [Dehalococcoidia bacterium]MCA9857016.1 nuclear transport factor 2 family protein [Dehalococcoidia bacterium]MCB9483242.1 nuclear transport factor 2 family protein [Dehalococcoidia bacterium]MCB9492323.1 nuclear transport factor 2 family protein [Dehalococcoidia bacterium]
MEDRLAIQELIARYNHAIDGGDPDGWAATFAPDGTFESRGEVHAGTEQLATFARGFQQRLPGARHWNNNLVIDGDGDQATTTCYLQLWREGQLASEGRYVDTLRKIDGQWRFASRKVVRD